VKLYRAEVVARELLGESVLLSYRWTGKSPAPGQFVVVRALEPSTSLDPFLNRPFFVHDLQDSIATLFFEVRGRGTTLLAQVEGEIFVSAPLGQGFRLSGEEEPVALVGGGVGASPLGLVSKYLAWRDVPHDVYLTVPEHQGELRGRLRGLFPQAGLLRTEGAAPDNGQAPVFLGELDQYVAIYASGPGPLLGAVRNAADSISCQLAVQERMACANGSCYGCAVPVWESGARTYHRACIEGPVFPAEVLAW
jgi:dihydroorotate dehydrogenase electron transfer subunit